MNDNVDDATPRIFVGSGTGLAVMEAVLVRSVLETAREPVTIDVIDCDNHVLRRVGGAATALPEAWRGRLAAGTVHSFARFAPPELCGFEGRAIYLEPDQVVLGDIAELWRTPLDGRSFGAVPTQAVRGDLHPTHLDGYLSSVLLFDCGRCRDITVVGVTDDLRSGAYDYQDAISMSPPFIDRIAADVGPLPSEWNELERCFEDTRLVHYTHGDRHPWRLPRHPEGRLWIDQFLDAVADHKIDGATLDAALSHGQISRRVRMLPRLPRRLVPAIDVTWQRMEVLRPRVAVVGAAITRLTGRLRSGLRRLLGRLRRREVPKVPG